ncbi:hypothetical protein AVEN_145620-1 [Araneus ventricosus]|uniref:Uncharacterized protein n=1 Tax=Araneus ventricosus TaxID=182803 RepID=A0A4Y2VRN7_ARAVE|nr:hypothetical protein AVEN_145620-1 [Araneus ventricosus]
MNVGPYKILGQIRQRVDCLSVCIIAYLFSFETNSLRMPTSGNACARKGRSETWQFAKNKFWGDFVRKQTFRESLQVLLRKRMSRGFEFVLILQTTRGSNFGLLATEVYLTPFIILVFSTCVRSIRESLGETTPAGSCGNNSNSRCMDLSANIAGRITVACVCAPVLKHVQSEI